jgi:hypothetical protein
MSEEVTTQEATQETQATTATETTTETVEQTTTEQPTETTAETAAPTTQQKPAWDLERQRRDEARAQELKDLKAMVAAQAAAIEELKTTRASASTQQEARKTLADLRQQAAKALKEADLDGASGALDEAFNALETELGTIKSKLAARDAQDVQANESRQWWANWAKDNADVPLPKAQELAAGIEAKYAKLGATGELLSKLVTEAFNEQVKSLKKPTKTATSQTTTATTTRVSAPAGAKVIPVESGARPSPNQARDAFKRIAGTLLQSQG